MTDRRITDDGVAGLPIHEGRAELLEEIMAVPTDNQNRTSATDELGARRRTRWLPVVGAAAAVAAIAAAVAVPSLLGGEDQKEPTTTDPGIVAAAPGNGELAVLAADGWALDSADSVDESGGELQYLHEDSEFVTEQMLDDDGDVVGESSGQSITFSISWYAADSYETYARDREEVGTPEEVDVLGRPATMRSYSRDDHSAMLEPKGDYFLEVRGQGIDEAEFVKLLGKLVAVTPKDLDAHLPDEFVTDSERGGVVEEMLADIPVPQGLDTSDLAASAQIDRYQLGANVTSAVACAWIGQFADAKAAGDDAAMQEAVDAMATSRDWAILQEMQPQGGWSDVVWEYADALAAGKVPVGYRGGIGCE